VTDLIMSDVVTLCKNGVNDQVLPLTFSVEIILRASAAKFAAQMSSSYFNDHFVKDKI